MLNRIKGNKWARVLVLLLVVAVLAVGAAYAYSRLSRQTGTGQMRSSFELMQFITIQRRDAAGVLIETICDTPPCDAFSLGELSPGLEQQIWVMYEALTVDDLWFLSITPIMDAGVSGGVVWELTEGNGTLCIGGGVPPCQMNKQAGSAAIFALSIDAFAPPPNPDEVITVYADWDVSDTAP